MRRLLYIVVQVDKWKINSLIKIILCVIMIKLTVAILLTVNVWKRIVSGEVVGHLLPQVVVRSDVHNEVIYLRLSTVMLAIGQRIG